MNSFARPTLMLSLLAFAGCAAPSPELVVQQAIEAARANDRAAFLACFTADSRPLLETFWRSLERADSALAQLAAGDVQVVSVQGLPRYEDEPQRALVTIREGKEELKLVTFLVGTMWRIDLMSSESYARELQMKF